MIDLRSLKGWRQYDELLQKQNPDFLGITMNTCEYEIAIECSRRAKELDPGIITVLGGIHPTMLPEDCLKTKVVDFILKGEGEISFPELVENPEKFPPVFWGETPDLDVIPFPDRELWPDYKKRIQFPFFVTKNQPFLPPMVEILIGRGCPWACRFCCGPGEKNLYTISKGDKRIPFVRQRSVSNVMEELVQLHKRYRFRSIVFYDDQFVINPEWVRDFCKAMHDYGFAEMNVRWWAASRADIVIKFPRLFAEMKKAGLKTLSIGFESFSDRMLKWINKGTTTSDYWRAVRFLQKLDIQIYGNFILGIPYEDGNWYQEDDIRTVIGMLKIKPDIESISFFTPIPGSYLYNFCKNNGLILEKASLGLRFTGERKIKNVDYDFLNKLLAF